MITIVPARDKSYTYDGEIVLPATGLYSRRCEEDERTTVPDAIWRIKELYESVMTADCGVAACGEAMPMCYLCREMGGTTCVWCEPRCILNVHQYWEQNLTHG